MRYGHAYPNTARCGVRHVSQECPAIKITMTQHEICAAPRLNGKVSLVTGSTSGIGLGNARALAAAGSAVVLSGYGKPEIHATQATIKSEFGVPVVYSPRRYVETRLDRGDDQDRAG